MRGYFGIGVENISKEANFGTIVRSAHAFGASFAFTLQPALDMDVLRVSDTAGSSDHLPYYEYESIDDMALPKGCQLVAVELTPDAVELPSFRHPAQAAYILGPEMGNVSDAVLERCDHVIKIPMKFCVNVGVAAAIVMYDRLLSMGQHEDRPVMPGGPKGFVDVKALESVYHGPRRKVRTKKDA